MFRLWSHLAGIALSVVGTAATVSQSCYGNSASPFPVEVSQPSGEKLLLYIRGSEFVHWYEFVPEVQGMNREMLVTPAGLGLGRDLGFTVVKNETGTYVFAALDDNGDLRAMDLVVGRDLPPENLPRRVLPSPERLDARAKEWMPGMEQGPARVGASGNVANLVILMRFRDHRQRPLPSPSDFDVLFNAPGGHSTLAPTGSVADVYRENSYGQLQLQSKIVGWIDLPKTEKEYAGGNSGLNTAIWAAIQDALDGVVAGGMVNFSDFDNEQGGAGDGHIDAITFVHSGFAAEFGGVDASGADYKDRIWSHRWSIPTWSANPAGVKVSNYNINPGLWGLSGSTIGRIGVISHELGHFFGLPDLYDTSHAGSGIGSWCLMANSWGFDGTQLRPPHMSAWCKMKLGWAHPTVITSPGTYSVQNTATSGANFFRINYAGGASTEYLLVENRQAIGNFEGGIPAGTDGVKGGLAVWHIDEAKPANNDPGYPGQPGWPSNGKHYKVALLQADGAYDLEKGTNRGDGNDLFRKGFKDQLTSLTVPSSDSYSGPKISDIHSVSASAGTMTFAFGLPTDDEKGGGGSASCCSVVAHGIVPYGQMDGGNAVIASASIELESDSVVQIIANGSAMCNSSGPITFTTGFFDQDLPTDPSLDEMWFESLRFITLHQHSWSNFGSTQSVELPKGTHTLYWKIWAGSDQIQLDCGVMLITAVPRTTSSVSVGSPRSLKHFERRSQQADSQGAAQSLATNSGGQTAVSNEPFNSIMEILSNSEELVNVRLAALDCAFRFSRGSAERSQELNQVLSKIVSNMNDQDHVRIACLKILHP